MRRDLKRGCATCRLRFSSQLTHCPVCHGESLSVYEATIQVQPTSRMAWLAKWLIVLSCLPAIGFVGFVGTALLKEGWPPKNALDIVRYVLGGMGAALGAAIAIAAPLTLWIVLIAALRFLLKFIVDRPRRTLRVTIETQPRALDPKNKHPMHRLWDKFEHFVYNQEKNIGKYVGLATLGLLGLQLITEVFGEARVIKLTSLRDFGESLMVLAVINIMGAIVLAIFFSIFGWFFERARDFLAKPPPLFDYDASPPPVENDVFLEKVSKSRTEITGRVVLMDDLEKSALNLKSTTPFKSVFSGQTCLAFRVEGDADGQPVDDAEATHFALIAEDQKRWVIITDDIVVALPEETKIRADGAQGFLGDRGLSERDLNVKEGVLREGDVVRVVGRRSELRVGSAGYRANDLRLLLDAGDGLPVVIRRIEEGT